MTAWTNPKTWGAATLPSAEMNTYVRDNTNHLKEEVDDRLKGNNEAAPTLTALSNTASEVVILSSTITDAVSNGDMIEVTLITKLLNNSGTTRQISWDVAFGGVEADLAIEDYATSAAEGYFAWKHVAILIGGNLEVARVFDGEQDGDAVSRPREGVQLASPTVTAGQTFELKATAEVAHASLTVTPLAGFVHHIKV